MAIRNEDVGRSDYTPEKQADYAALVGLALTMCRGAANNPTWGRDVDRDCLHVIDLNAGDGGTDDVPGSPLIVAQAAEARRQRVHLWLCEENPHTMMRLRSRLERHAWQYVRFEFVDGDHTETIRQIATYYRGGRRRFGWVYSDPNPTPMPVTTIRHLLSVPCLTTLDIIASVAANGAYKRTRHLHGAYLAAHIAAIAKKAGYIRHKSRDWQWTMLFLTNYAKPINLRSMGFYGLTTPQGRDILSELNFTNDERQGRFW